MKTSTTNNPIIYESNANSITQEQALSVQLRELEKERDRIDREIRKIVCLITAIQEKENNQDDCSSLRRRKGKKLNQSNNS